MPHSALGTPKIVSVTFEVTTGPGRPWFNIPKGVTRLLGLNIKDDIHLDIFDLRTGRALHPSVDETLKSSTEICGILEVTPPLQPNQRIRVVASCPK